MRRGIAHIIFIGLLGLSLILEGPSLKAKGTPQQKAQFIYEFMQSGSVIWPENVMGKTFKIGVLRDSSVHQVLKQMIGPEFTVNNKPVRVQYYHTLEDIEECQLLYFDHTVPYTVNIISEMVRRSTTLLVGSRFPFNTVMINFIPELDTNNININRNMLDDHGLAPSSRLLSQSIKTEQEWKSRLNDAQWQRLHPEKEREKNFTDKMKSTVTDMGDLLKNQVKKAKEKGKEAQRKIFQEQVQKLVGQVDTLRQSFQNRLLEQQRAHRRQQEKLRKSYQKKIKKQKKNYEKQLAQLRKEHQQQLSRVKAALKTDKKTLVTRYEDRIDTLRKQQRQKLAIARGKIASKEDTLAEVAHILGQRKNILQQKESRINQMTDSLLSAKEEIEQKEYVLMEKNQQLQYQRQIRYGMGAIVLLTMGLAFFIYRSYRINKKAKNELAIHNQQIRQQKEVIEQKNRDITAGIRYAKRIQDAIMPPSQYVQQYIPESFILFRPKEVVSGDFYWVKAIDNKRLAFSVVDCTGHGVPGAFISMVGYNSMVRAINEFNLREPGKILDKLNELVKEALQQEYTDVKDGMDMAFCLLNFETQTLQYAGANNPLYVVRDGELHETKADPQPIGSYDFMDHFTNHEFDLQEDDAIYVFSDGYPDQFGGPNDKKFMYKRFKETLVDLQGKSMLKQQNHLNEIFDDWKGDQEQIDDVCIIGVRV